MQTTTPPSIFLSLTVTGCFISYCLSLVLSLISFHSRTTGSNIQHRDTYVWMSITELEILTERCQKHYETARMNKYHGWGIHTQTHPPQDGVCINIYRCTDAETNKLSNKTKLLRHAFFLLRRKWNFTEKKRKNMWVGEKIVYSFNIFMCLQW